MSSSSQSQNIGTDVLRTLHRVQRQLADLRDRQQRGPKRVEAAELSVKHHEKQLADARAEYERLRMLSDRKQLDLKAGEDRVREWRLKLNAAASNAEYQALREQIAAKEMANSVLADEILEALEQIDEFQPKVSRAEAALQAARQKAAATHAEVDEKGPAIQADLKRLERELKEAEASLPAEVRELYLRVVRQKGEDALAPIEGEYCGGCRQHVPLNVCSKVMMGEPMFCRSCGRMLYIPERPDAGS